MNEYKLQYHYPESSIDTAYIVERTEAAARKTLIKRFGKEIEIDDTELVSTDANATKEQERETLEKIKAMVEELGPQSYLKTAFTGVYEVAEMNIEEDAAYSFPGRISLLEEQLREMGSKYNAAHSDAEVLRSQLDHAQEQVDALKGRQLPAWLQSAAYGLVVEELAAAQKRMEQSAETMAYYAEAPRTSPSPRPSRATGPRRSAGACASRLSRAWKPSPRNEPKRPPGRRREVSSPGPMMAGRTNNRKEQQL